MANWERCEEEFMNHKRKDRWQRHGNNFIKDRIRDFSTALKSLILDNIHKNIHKSHGDS